MLIQAGEASACGIQQRLMGRLYPGVSERVQCAAREHMRMSENARAAKKKCLEIPTEGSLN